MRRKVCKIALNLILLALGLITVYLDAQLLV